MKTYGYTRVSTAGQADDGVSLDAQTVAIKCYCQTYGLELMEIIEDAGASGATLRRPGMQSLLELVDLGVVQAIVTFKIDRFSRSVKDLFTILPHLEEKNVQFHSVKEKIDTQSAFGRAMLGVIGIFSQLERETTGERTAFALAHIKEKAGGRQINGGPPFGFAWEDGELVEVKREVMVLEMIKHLRLQDRSATWITEWLNLQGKQFATRGGGKWYRTQVYRILRQPNPLQVRNESKASNPDR